MGSMISGRSGAVDNELCDLRFQTFIALQNPMTLSVKQHHLAFNLCELEGRKRK